MKTKLLSMVFGLLLLALPTAAQDKTVVTANNNDISDNLDLRAIATIFGDASNLDDFEKRINDPKTQISNLDLNNDNLVDYLRVIESVENKQHIIVIQAVLDKDVYQDVASIEVQKDKNNKVQVQVVGDVYMYGDNYIYEPIYTHNPIIYNTFWVNSYRPYCSSWYWNYYPDYYSCWNPFPVFRYRNNIHLQINFGYSYNYVNYRNCQAGYYSYYGRRGNGYEIHHPDYSFSHRNRGYANRQEMDNNREIRTRVNGTREITTQLGNTRGNTRNEQPRIDTPRNIDASPRGNSPRNNTEINSPREITQPRGDSPRNNQPRVETPRADNSELEIPRVKNTPRFDNPRGNSENNQPREINTPRSEQPRFENPRGSSSNNQPREISTPRSEQPRSEQPRGNSGGNNQPRMDAPRNEQPRNNGGGNTRGNENSGRGRG
jgi:hypothetical protein